LEVKAFGNYKKSNPRSKSGLLLHLLRGFGTEFVFIERSGAKFIIMEWSLFSVYNNMKVSKKVLQFHYGKSLMVTVPYNAQEEIK